MALVLRALLEILRIIRLARGCIRRFPVRGASLLALLGRKLNWWRRFWQENFGDFGRPKSTERRFLETKASSYSVSGDSAVVREYVVAASYVPQSASHPSLHEQIEGQPATAAQTAQTIPVHDTLSVNHPYVPNPPGGPHHLPHPLDGRTLQVGNRSTGNLSAVSNRSQASDRYSIITNSRESLRGPHGQTSRYPRGPHRQFGRGPDPARDPSRSRERPTRPSTPATRPHTPTHWHPPRLEISTASPSTHAALPSIHAGDGPNPVVQPSPSSPYAHGPRSPPPMSETRRRQSSTIDVDIRLQNPSTESLSIFSSANPPQITDEPFTMDKIVHSSSDSPAVNLRDEPAPGSPTSSNYPTSEDLNLPEGRFLQLINSDQVPRYTKDATMQVGYIIQSLHAYISLQTPRGDRLSCGTINNQIPPVRCILNNVVQLNRALSSFPEPNGSEQVSLRQDCSPWTPATHPDGALYFYDEERVRVSVITQTPSHD
jgi:hypothetical protein